MASPFHESPAKTLNCREPSGRETRGFTLPQEMDLPAQPSGAPVEHILDCDGWPQPLDHLLHAFGIPSSPLASSKTDFRDQPNTTAPVFGGKSNCCVKSS
jgi:hypothetical protein